MLPSRLYAFVAAVLLTLVSAGASLVNPYWLILTGIAGALSLVGIYDLSQKHHSLKRNYPILANFRFFFEMIRPEIRQYLLESDNEAVPFSRAQRSLVYQRSKNVEDKRPFGTELDVYVDGYEWINHSMQIGRASCRERV